MDLCDTGRQCSSNEYKDWSFDNQATILAMTMMSQDDFETWWATAVSVRFGLEFDDVMSCYGANDPYETDGNLRTLWKYGTAKGVNGTPVAFVNGVKLDEVPMTVDGWLKILNSVYTS